MNLLSSLSTSQVAARCQEDWHLVARDPEFKSQELKNREFKNLASVTLFSSPIAIAKVWMETEDCSVLLNDTIVLSFEDNTTINANANDRTLGLSMHLESPIGIKGLEIEGYRHNSDSESNSESDSERLLVKLNQQQTSGKQKSGRYRKKSTVPQ